MQAYLYFSFDSCLTYTVKNILSEQIVMLRNAQWSVVLTYVCVGKQVSILSVV